MIHTDKLELVGSSVVEYENSRNPYPLRRQWVARCLSLADHVQQVDEAICRRAEALASDGLSAIDALHISCAEAAQCDYFLTCDDQVVRRYTGNRIGVCNPVNFLVRVTREENDV